MTHPAKAVVCLCSSESDRCFARQRFCCSATPTRTGGSRGCLPSGRLQD